MLKLKTGLSRDDIELIEGLCHEELAQFRTRKRRKIKEKSQADTYLSPFNILLATLNFLWAYPKGGYRELAKDFGTQKDTIKNYIRSTLKLLATKLEYLRRWPSNYHGRIDSGPFKNVVGCVDTFPVFLLRPEDASERSKFFQYKKRSWAYKVQVFVNILTGKIMDIDKVYPYGEFADTVVYKASLPYKKLDQNNWAVALVRKTTHFPTRIKQGAADKGYKGILHLITPHKHPSNRTLSEEEKEYNKELSSIRAVVEQVQSRVKKFNVLGTLYRGKKHDAQEQLFLNSIVQVIGSLVNLQMEKDPIRKNPRTIKISK
jgi:hypothetical protein